MQKASYQRHEPENTPLYKVMQNYLNTFLDDACRAGDGDGVPAYVVNELAAYLDCGILAQGFVRLYCPECRTNSVVAFSCKRRGFCPSCGARRMSNTAAHLVDHVIPHVPVRQWVLTLPYRLRFMLSRRPALVTAVLGIYIKTISSWMAKIARKQGIKGAKTGAFTVVQRFGGALNLNIHFHSLVLDGVYMRPEKGLPPVFKKLTAPSNEDVAKILDTIIGRIAKMLDGKGYHIECQEQGGMYDGCLSASIQQRLKTWGGVPGTGEQKSNGPCSARSMGYSLNANVVVGAKKRERLENLCKYLMRPPIALERMIELSNERIGYRLRHPFSDGSTHVIFEPLELIEKLAALVPPPRANLVRYHGVLAPRYSHRRSIVPSVDMDDEHARVFSESRRLEWSALLKRVFDIDVLKCSSCGGKLKVISMITQKKVIRPFLESMKLPAEPPVLMLARPPPQICMGF
ncbi:MAG: hypothetical protein A2583_04445 [Bdellovibrionales bacterium RIFOXYD1_FULL_53_11]|nr:MAG: hypothetical protein A2583_04445 [Bdellovibrionales bacterium RIFOXYD1_FULL_53_11]